jgi:hypothetical protein
MRGFSLKRIGCWTNYGRKARCAIGWKPNWKNSARSNRRSDNSLRDSKNQPNTACHRRGCGFLESDKNQPGERAAASSPGCRLLFCAAIRAKNSLPALFRASF